LKTALALDEKGLSLQPMAILVNFILLVYLLKLHQHWMNWFHTFGHSTTLHKLNLVFLSFLSIYITASPLVSEMHGSVEQSRC
jgi:hypothetical protein